MNWKLAATHMDVPVNDATAVMVDEYIYVIGGRDRSSSPRKLVQIASADLCDKRVQWQQSFTLPRKLEKLAATHYNGVIYVVGGRDENRDVWGETYSSIIVGPGQILDWNDELPSLDDAHPGHPLFTHSIFAANDYLYAIGGISLDSTGAYEEQRSIYAAKIISPGVISDWAPLPVTSWLTSTVYSHRTLVAGNRVYVLGGYREGASIDEVFSAELRPDGSIGPWIAEEIIPERYHWHGAILASNGSVYVAGGLTDDNLQESVYYFPPLNLTKSNDPSGPVHEGDIITYTISYANTSLITQTITISDPLPFNVILEHDSIQPPEFAHLEGSTIIWELGERAPGESGQVSFRVRVPLLPSVDQTPTIAAFPQDYPPARVLPVPIACDTTRFWAAGVTRQPPVPNPHTIEVAIPPGSNPTAIWLAVKSTGDIPLTVDGVQAERVATSHGLIGASLWSARISPQAVASGTITIVTYAPRRLNAIFLFDEDDPPFDPAALDDFQNTTRTFTYTLDIPSVATKTIDVLLPYMDITYWTDDLLPDTRSTQVDVEFDGQSHRITANDPNLGNGLLMTQFPFTISPFTEPVRMKELTVTVDTEDSIYTLGPRVCRPVYIENTAWLCSEQAGCISDTVVIIPDDFMVLPEGNIYLPLILKAQP